ncbi:aminotransferase class III-fold pyridoxal phosphate-dependent enzyme [Escherichia coli]|uniref:aminotransferase class III-fold pyridoxal phosphate-dependent enzyme n=1 Tax=Escherichia coli TaxID=562 RepID=UPI00132909CE|nr:aminotransferase class III-fold pyridoxal phosphate-dependent enzyme [Escherichia coli]MWR61719.1 aminotransferase class III-fold pyridoxal phosphate-dependent enzyme [Escherichia coli]
MSNNEFHQRRLSATPRGVGVMCNFFAQSAENATLKDVEGNEYIDFAAGIAVLNTGHRHPDLVAAVEQQLQQFTHTAYHLHGISTQDSLDAIERLFKSDIEAKQVAAIIFEPVQGEGGFNVAPKELVAAIRRLCDEHGIVMIADEVQSGFARTGKLFAMDHYADKLDLMTMAKSLAGGMPLSGVVGNANIMDAPAPGGLGGTYAGNPLAVAAAHAVLNIIDKESLCERANQLGQRLKNTLIDAKESVPAIAAVRGLGSMIAAEFNDPQTGEPSAAIAQKIQQRALAQGLLLLTCGAYGNVIRFLYPLTIPDAQFDAAMKILQDALSD